MSHSKKDGAHDFLCSLKRINKWRLSRKKCSKVCKCTIAFVNKIVANDCNLAFCCFYSYKLNRTNAVERGEIDVYHHVVLLGRSQSSCST